MAQSHITDTEVRVAQRFGRAAVAAGGDYLWATMLPDGRGIYLMPTFDGVRLAIGPAGDIYFDDTWCYPRGQGCEDAGWRAALGWDGEGEPEGWYRHPNSGRRRPNGDPEREHVYA